MVRKTLKLLCCTATGFTITHGLLFLLQLSNPALYGSILYHYSDAFTWYFIFFLVPLLGGCIFYLWLRDKPLSKGLKMLFGAVLVLQAGFTGTAAIINYKYWGYAFKRPPVFQEIQYADRVETCARVTNADTSGIHGLHSIPDTTKPLDHLLGREDPYYGVSDRIFMVFEDRAPATGQLYDVPKIYNNPALKASAWTLRRLDGQINASGLIDQGTTRWDTSGQVSGIVTEFFTAEGPFIFAGLNGGQVANDHYPCYEFLFTMRKGQYVLIKKQRFYTDMAGIEKLEYANLAPFCSLLLTAAGLVAAGIIGLVNSVMSRKKRMHSDL